MKLMPIVYVSEMAKAIRFYQALGMRLDHGDESSVWVEMGLGTAILALHHSDPMITHNPLASRIELALVSEEPLESLVDRLTTQGITLERGITQEPFGRSIVVRDPDGLLIQINEH